MSIKPRTRVPDLDLSTLEGGRFNLGTQHPREFTLLLLYRGLHCPVCKTYVRDLDRKLDEFDKRGVGVVAISTDKPGTRGTIEAGLGHRAPYDRLRIEHRGGASLGTVHLNIHQGKRAAPIFRAGTFSHPPRCHAVLRLGPDDAVRATALH